MKKRSSKNCCLPFCKSKVKEPPKAIQEHNEVPALRSPSNKDLVARTTAMTPQANKEESYFPSKQRRRLEDYLDLKKSEDNVGGIPKFHIENGDYNHHQEPSLPFKNTSENKASVELSGVKQEMKVQNFSDIFSQDDNNSQSSSERMGKSANNSYSLEKPKKALNSSYTKRKLDFASPQNKESDSKFLNSRLHLYEKSPQTEPLTKSEDGKNSKVNNPSNESPLEGDSMNPHLIIISNFKGISNSENDVKTYLNAENQSNQRQNSNENQPEQDLRDPLPRIIDEKPSKKHSDSDDSANPQMKQPLDAENTDRIENKQPDLLCSHSNSCVQSKSAVVADHYEKEPPEEIKVGDEKPAAGKTQENNELNEKIDEIREDEDECNIQLTESPILNENNEGNPLEGPKTFLSEDELNDNKASKNQLNSPNKSKDQMSVKSDEPSAGIQENENKNQHDRAKYSLQLE